MNGSAFSYKWFFFSFEGRINRAKYWAYMGLVLSVGFALAVWLASTGTDMDAIQGVLFLIGLGILYPSLAVQAKRLYDFNYSGWWNLLSFLGVINLGVFLVCGIRKGTKGPNLYGPDPMESKSVADPALADADAR